jgi:hypothetical protein
MEARLSAYRFGYLSRLNAGRPTLRRSRRRRTSSAICTLESLPREASKSSNSTSDGVLSSPQGPPCLSLTILSTKQAMHASAAASILQESDFSILRQSSRGPPAVRVSLSGQYGRKRRMCRFKAAQLLHLPHSTQSVLIIGHCPAGSLSSDSLHWNKSLFTSQRTPWIPKG